MDVRRCFTSSFKTTTGRDRHYAVDLLAHTLSADESSNAVWPLTPWTYTIKSLDSPQVKNNQNPHRSPTISFLEPHHEGDTESPPVI